MFRKIVRYVSIWILNAFFSGTHFYRIKRVLLRASGAHVGDNAKVVGPVFFTADLTIGSNTFIGRDFKVYGNGAVRIGTRCDIAPDVSIFTGSHEIGDSGRRAGKGKSFFVDIKDGCWIGARSSITGNVKIDEGAVVACGAVVIKNVPGNTLVGGVPARNIRELQ